MKLLSIQQVEAYGFTLYFLAFTDETPPNEDLNSIEIREWLWQRPYTTIELQHIPDAKLQAKLYIQSNISQVFLLRQIWIVKYYVIYSVK